MQIMPLPDGAGAMFGCMILLLLIATFFTTIGAIAAGLRARKRQQPEHASGPRIIGAISFAIGIALIAYESHYAYPQPVLRLIPLGALALAGVGAWLAGSFAASNLEKRMVLGSMSVAVLAVIALITYDADYRVRRDRLISAAKRGDAHEVRAMLATGLSANALDIVGVPIIRSAKNAATAQVLMEAGATPASAWPALVEAAGQGDLALVKVFLATGVDPNVEHGKPSRHAWWNGHTEVLEELRRAGAADAGRLQQRNGKLLSAVRGGDPAAVQAELADDYLMQERIDGLRIAAAIGNRDVTMALVNATQANPDLAITAVTAARNNHIALFGEVLHALEERRAGFIVRETKVAALAEAPEKSEELLRLTEDADDFKPPLDSYGVRSLRERAAAPLP